MARRSAGNTAVNRMRYSSQSVGTSNSRSGNTKRSYPSRLIGSNVMCSPNPRLRNVVGLTPRTGGTKHLFGSVYAPSTIGTLLRESTFGHNRQLESVLRDHLVGLAHRTEILPGIADRAFVDIDSLLRPVYGHAKQGASYGHSKIAGKRILRKGLSLFATIISTADSDR